MASPGAASAAVRAWLGLFLCLCVCTASAASKIGLLYEKPQDPSASIILESIVDGIRQAGDKQLLVAASAAGDPAPIDVNDWIRRENLGTVITLGHARDHFRIGGATARVVSGGLDLSPDSNPDAIGVSLAVDPALFFDYLRKLLPRIKHVYVIHEQKDRWLIARARKAAEERGLTLNSAEAVGEYAHGAQLYKDLLPKIEPDIDALWLPINDKRLDRGNVLPWLIEESWVRRFAIFSNSFDDVRMGATFGLYPDPVAYGKSLYEMAANPKSRGVQPAGVIRSAVQLRFARHLGADFGAVRFDVSFPLK